MMQLSPTEQGNCMTFPPLDLTTAFSITTLFAPIVTGAPSALMTAPNRTAQPSSIVTSPLTVADGATYALAWMFGFLVPLETIMYTVYGF